jgi:hypothetical protein
MPLFGRLFDMRRYDLAFAIAAVLPAIGYAGWAWINRSADRGVELEVGVSPRALI